jgi:prevent-host-death family protein
MSEAQNHAFSFETDLVQGVLPISRAASSLAAKIKWVGTNQKPIVITQKGYPTGVLISVEMFRYMQQLADQQG